MRVTRDQPRPGRGHACTCCRPCGSATPGPGACPAPAPTLSRRSAPSTTQLRRGPSGAGRLVLAVRRRRPTCCSATTRPTPSGSTAWRADRRTPRTASTTTWCTAPRRSTPTGSAPRRPCTTLLTVPAGGTAEVRVRLVAGAEPAAADRTGVRRGDDEPARGGGRLLRGAHPGRHLAQTRRAVLRQAVAGLMWGKQFFHYDVERWLAGDPAGPPPPAGREHGRNAGWAHLNNADVISMPDPWEYPWYAAWDLAFHCVADRACRPGVRQGPAAARAARVVHAPERPDPGVRVGLRRRQPAGARLGGAARLRDRRRRATTTFLARVSTSCCSTSPGGSTARTAPATTSSRAASSAWTTSVRSTGPRRCRWQRGWSRATARRGWRCTALNLLEIALVLAEHDRPTRTSPPSSSSTSPTSPTPMRDQGLWDERGRLLLRRAALRRRRQRCRCACARWSACSRCARPPTLGVGRRSTRLPDFADRLRWFLANKPRYRGSSARRTSATAHDGRLLSIVDADRLVRILPRCSPRTSSCPRYGLRSLSRRHRDEPFSVDLGGRRSPWTTSRASRPPACSAATRTGADRCGSRSTTWSSRRCDASPASSATTAGRASGRVGHQAHAGRSWPTTWPARLVGTLPRRRGRRRPVFGDEQLFQDDPAWHDLLPFHEYFHGDTGAGLGASHQTGWTGLVADLLMGGRR